MSRQNPPSAPDQETERAPQYDERPVELARGERAQLQWLVVETPEQSFLLDDDDYVLDSYFNPQYDAWEVLIRTEPSDGEE